MRRTYDAVAERVGEVGILASAGGLGKSTLVLETGERRRGLLPTSTVPSMAACGLAVAAGPVVVVSYEDAPARIAHRLTWCNAGNVPGAVHLSPRTRRRYGWRPVIEAANPTPAPIGSGYGERCATWARAWW